MVVTWKTQDLERRMVTETRAPSPGAFLRVSRCKSSDTRDDLWLSTFAVRRGREEGWFVYDRGKRDGAEGVEVSRGKNERLTIYVLASSSGKIRRTYPIMTLTGISCFHIKSLHHRLWVLQLATQQRTLNHGNEGFEWPSAGFSFAIEQDCLDPAQQQCPSRFLVYPECPGHCLFRPAKHATCHKTARCPWRTSCASCQPSG
jgi:hypothetical protein